jgi:hypothetical protein
VVREAYAGTVLQRVAYSFLQLSLAATTIAAAISLFGTNPLNWASRPAGFYGGGVIPERTGEMYAGAAPGYLVGAVAAILIGAACFRFIAPRSRDVGFAASRRYRRTLRERDGIRLLLARGGLRVGIVVVALILVGLAAIALVNLTGVEEGWSAEAGIYLALVLPLIGLAATACLWPFGSQLVYMDRQGLITRG